jgi:hypothetical protein
MNHTTTYRTSGWPTTWPTQRPATTPLRDRLRGLLWTPGRGHHRPAPPPTGTA